VAPFADMPYYDCTSAKSTQQLLSQAYCAWVWTCNIALHVPVRTLHVWAHSWRMQKKNSLNF